jgi:hypothetical protein
MLIGTSCQWKYSRETGHLVFWRFHFYGKCVNQALKSFGGLAAMVELRRKPCVFYR